MGLPEEPSAFVAEAERALNSRDPDALACVYSEAAVIERVDSGNEEVHRGAAEIRLDWQRYVDDSAARDLVVQKSLVSASGDTIAAEWEAAAEGRVERKGVEYWRFDDEGKVYEHRIYGHAATEPPESPLKRLRLALVHPVAALALLREQRRRRS
jgi:nuclear transport factor 2 (NTF2) superfamily protein